MPEPVAGTPADPTVRYTELKLNGKTYQLTYDFESIAQAEETTGIELLVGVDWRKINARRIRAMLYASMVKAQPDITLKEIGKLITVLNLPNIESALVDCWMNSTPEKEEETENPPKPDDPS